MYLSTTIQFLTRPVWVFIISSFPLIVQDRTPCSRSLFVAIVIRHSYRLPHFLISTLEASRASLIHFPSLSFGIYSQHETRYCYLDLVDCRIKHSQTYQIGAHREGFLILNYSFVQKSSFIFKSFHLLLVRNLVRHNGRTYHSVSYSRSSRSSCSIFRH